MVGPSLQLKYFYLRQKLNSVAFSVFSLYNCALRSTSGATFKSTAHTVGNIYISEIDLSVSLQIDKTILRIYQMIEVSRVIRRWYCNHELANLTWKFEN